MTVEEQLSTHQANGSQPEGATCSSFRPDRVGMSRESSSKNRLMGMVLSELGFLGVVGAKL